MKKVFLFAALSGILLSVLSCNGKPMEKEKSDVVVENILSRKSVREYTEKTVERSVIDTLMRSAMAAPSAMDKRPWEFIVLDDRAVLDDLATSLPYAKMLTKAPLAIIVCGDTSVSEIWYLDCSAAAQNILLAAESMGLGAVWTAGYPYAERTDAIKAALELPENIVPLCVIPVGYPSSTSQPKDKYNETKVHFNEW